MPIIKSASKKLRADRNKEKNNNVLRNLLKKTIKIARKNPTAVNISKATKVLDKVAKKNLIHKNKAARIKSSLSKLVKESKKLAKSK